MALLWLALLWLALLWLASSDMTPSGLVSRTSESGTRDVFRPTADRSRCAACLWTICHSPERSRFA